MVSKDPIRRGNSVLVFCVFFEIFWIILLSILISTKPISNNIEVHAALTLIYWGACCIDTYLLRRMIMSVFNVSGCLQMSVFNVGGCLQMSVDVYKCRYLLKMLYFFLCFSKWSKMGGFLQVNEKHRILCFFLCFFRSKFSWVPKQGFLTSNQPRWWCFCLSTKPQKKSKTL